MFYTSDHVLKLTGEATQKINDLLDATGEIKRTIGLFRRDGEIFLAVTASNNQYVEFSTEDGTLEIESVNHNNHSFVIGTEALEEGIDFTSWWYDSEAQTLVFSEGDDEDE